MRLAREITSEREIEGMYVLCVADENVIYICDMMSFLHG